MYNQIKERVLYIGTAIPFCYVTIFNFYVHKNTTEKNVVNYDVLCTVHHIAVC